MSTIRHRPYQSMEEEERRQLTDACLSLATHVISTEGKGKNLVLSPLSLHVVLEMKKALRTHAQNSSKAAEILSYVFAESRFGGPCLSCANGAWFDQSLDVKPELLEILQNAFKSAIAHVDFRTKAEEVRNEVNAWANKKTHGLIKEVLPSGSVCSNTDIIYANAVYFKGAWDEKFVKSMTKDDKFFLLDGSSVAVPFMTGCRRDRSATAFDGFKVLRLSYQRAGDYKQDSRWFSMYVFLPDERDGLAALLERMRSESGFLDRYLPKGKAMLRNLRIPKFEIDFGFQLSVEVIERSLTKMPGGNNNLMSTRKDVFHKAFIKVDEEGTEAAAVSALRMCCAAAPPPITATFDFVADHPFLFVIREGNIGPVLFVGQVLNPLAR